MKYLFSSLFLLLATLVVLGQNTSSLTIKNDKNQILCYAVNKDGYSIKNTTVEFKNNSTCSGNCLYVWDFGDGRAQQITEDKTEGTHEYKEDGIFDVSLATINTASIHDSITGAKITEIQYVSTENDSVNLLVTYRGVGNVEKYADIRIPQNEFDKKEHSTPIKVYSPVVESTNFTFEIENPSDEDLPAAIQSFTYTLAVDTVNFTPHDKDMWHYYWKVEETNMDGNPIAVVNRFNTSSLRYKYTFPKESFDPGYLVTLNIALDSSKFEDSGDIEYFELEGCHTAKSQIVEVTDHFFNDESQKEEDVEDRIANIPNIFTPGGNDENEVFYFNTNGVDVFSIRIYNSWGGLVYFQEARAISWVGKDNSGGKCPSGTYYYVINSSNSDNRHETSGYIHLFRQD